MCVPKKEFLEKVYVGRTIEIINMVGEPTYAGKTGKVEFIDDALNLHGSWGSCSLLYGVDNFSIVE